MAYPSAWPGSDAVLVGRSDSGELPVHEHPAPLYGWLFGNCRCVDGGANQHVIVTEVAMQEAKVLRGRSVR